MTVPFHPNDDGPRRLLQPAADPEFPARLRPFGGAAPDALRAMIAAEVQAALEREFAQHLGAGAYERTPERRGLRNGSRPRTLLYQESGRLAMYLKPGTNLAGAIQVARAHLPKTRGLSEPISVFPARFTYSQLTAWREVVNADGVDRSGLILDDIDERRNQLLFGVESPEAGVRLRRALVDRGVPDEAIVTEVRELPRLTQTVTDSTNPVVGGIYVKGDTLSGCTMGFNAKWNGVMHFVTASHCTTNIGPLAQTYKYLGMGVLTGVLMCQPTCDDSARWAPFQSKLGPEVLDPAYQNTPGYWGSLCASDELCRMADAALIRYDYRIPTVYQIAFATTSQPADPQNPPVIIGTCCGTVIGETIGNNQLVGTYIWRTGISTGSNIGQISQTCFHVRTYARPGGKTLKLVCQNEMGSNVEPGDSGGPVYYADLAATTSTESSGEAE